MNGGIDKLADAIKEKVSKKQIVSVIGIVAIGWKIEAPAEMQSICIVIIVAMNQIAQSILDYFGGTKNEDKTINTGAAIKPTSL